MSSDSLQYRCCYEAPHSRKTIKLVCVCVCHLVFWVGVHCSDFQKVEGDLHLKKAKKTAKHHYCPHTVTVKGVCIRMIISFDILVLFFLLLTI